MVRPERFELPTAWFVARYSIQLSYGRIRKAVYYEIILTGCQGQDGVTVIKVAEREGFEPSMEY